MELAYPQDINFFTTYQCNSRCQNCFIWQGQRQSPDKNELEALDCALDMIISQELKKPSHFPARLVFIKKITDYYRGIQKDLPCMALKSGIVIDLYGDVFPDCPAMMKAIGNLHEQSLSDIWRGKKAYEIRAKIDKLKCGGCWNDCQVVTNIAMDRGSMEEEYAKIKISALNLEAMYVPASIDFNSSDSSLLLSGWYDLEGDSEFRYRWTEQQFSLLLPGCTSFIEIFAMFPGNLKGEGRKLELFADGVRKSVLILDGYGWRKYSIPLKTSVAHVNACRFRLSSYYCPMESGKGDDWRKLGAAINRITFL